MKTLEEKGEIALYEQFLLFPQCFYRINKLSPIFTTSEIVVCEQFQFETLLNL